MRPQSRSRRLHTGRLQAGLAVAVVALALPPLSFAAAATFSAVLHAPNHQPVENKPWTISVDVTRGKVGLSGDVNYRFLFDGAVVGHQPGHKFSHGVYHDSLTFPPDSVGEKLTLQVVVTTKYGTKYLPWAITPRT